MDRIGPIWIRVGSVLEVYWPELDSCDTDMGRIGPIWIRLGSALDLFWSEMDSFGNRYGSDRPDMDSELSRSGFVLTRHGFV